MNRPRVFFLSTSLNIGGTERFLVQLSERLRAGYDIEIGYLKEKGALGALLEQKGFRVHDFASLIKLYSYLRKRRVELLQTFLYRAHVIGRICGKMAGVPVVISTQQAVDIWKSAPLSLLDRLSAPLCDLIITNSRAAKESLARREKVDPDRMRVIYNGIDGAGFAVDESRESVRRELGIPEDAVVAVSVTRLHRDKGADYLPAIAAGADGVHFLVAGDGPERNAVEDGFRAGGMEGRCRMLGWRSDVARLLKASDIFLLPSREESFPQAVLEAMAMSLPVIAADVGGVRELVEDGNTGIVVSPGNTRAFSAALRELASSGETRERMGNNGRAKSVSFSEERMVKEMDAVYREMLARSNGSRAA